MVHADGEEGHKAQNGTHRPQPNHNGGQTDVGKQERQGRRRTFHPPEMDGKGSVHGPVRQADEDHGKERHGVDGVQVEQHLKRTHRTTFCGRLNIHLETPRINGTLGMARMTLNLKRHDALPVMNRMNSSPVSPCAIRVNRFGA